MKIVKAELKAHLIKNTVVQKFFFDDDATEEDIAEELKDNAFDYFNANQLSYSAKILSITEEKEDGE